MTPSPPSLFQNPKYFFSCVIKLRPQKSRGRTKIFDLDSETLLSPCRKNAFAVVTVFIIILAVYSNTFDASWHFDDYSNIITNKPLHLTELNWQNIKKTFFADWHGSGKLYRPMACLSFALNYYVGRTEVSGYHVVNIVIHFMSAVFLFFFIYHTLNLPLLKTRYGPNSYFIAFLATMLWAISPVQTQAITYVVQRMASMAGMFYIMAMYFYLKGRTSGQKPLKATHYFFCLICGILALGSKENAVMLPVSILLFDLFLIQGLTKKNIIRNSLVCLALILFCLSLALVLKGPSVLQLVNLSASYYGRGFTLLERLLTEPRVVLFYVSLLLYPMPYRLCISHDISVSEGLFDPPATIIAILAIFAILALTLFRSKRWPFISFCILFFFVNHAIESTILPLDLVFEHRNYIPSMLFFAPIAILIAKGLRSFSDKRSMQFIISTFVVLVLVALGHSTFMRNFAWKTEETLWLDAVEKSPNLTRPHHNLGKYYADIDLRQMALEQYREALRLPDGPNRWTHHLTYYNMGLNYKALKEYDKAERYLLKAVEMEPRLSPAYTCLGILNTEKGRNDKALEYFVKALSHDINSQLARNYTGLVLLRQKRLTDAVTQFREALKMSPSDLYALTHLGIAYKYKGEFNEAIRYFRKVLSISKRYVTAYLHLMEVYFLKGEGKRAEQTAEKLIDLFPDDKLSLLVDKRIIQTEPLLEPPNLEIILPVLEKALIKRGGQYHAQARKLKNHRERRPVR